MAGIYSRFGSDSPAHIRNLILGALADTPEPSNAGIMSRTGQPPSQMQSRFSGVSGPSPIIQSPDAPEERSRSFIEGFATMLGMASDDPEAVANAVLPRETAEEPDMSAWESLPPAPGQERVRSNFRENQGSEGSSFNLESALDEVMANEGGFQQLRNDRGNYVNGRLIGTNFGVTPAALAEYRGVDASSITVDDIRNLDEGEARQIFLDNYYFRPGLDRLPEHLQANVFDMYVNSGTNAIKILQDMLGVEEDGILGPETLEALENTNITNDMYADRRIQYYTGVARNRPSQRGFLDGWINRANRYKGE